MISDRHKTVFVHVPKAAGQSVEQAFLDDLGLDWKARAPLLLRPNDDPAKGPPRLAHLAARDYVALGHMTQAQWDASYRFAVVRDPFSRAVSLYRHLGPDMAFRDWVATWLGDTLAAGPAAPARWFVRSQVDYLCDADGKVLVTDVLRFESLADEFPRAARAAGLTSDRLPRRNATRHKPQPDIDGPPPRLRRLARSLRALTGRTRFERLDDWRAHYDADTAGRIASLYAGDFACFGYPTDAPRR